MEKYAAYVWTSYALFGAMLAWDFLAPRLRERRALREARLRARREAARKAA